MDALVAPRRVLTLTAAVAVALSLCAQARPASLTRARSIAAQRHERDSRLERPATPAGRRPSRAGRPRGTRAGCCRFRASSTAPSPGGSGASALRAPRVGENLAWGVGSLAGARCDREHVAREPGAPREPAARRLPDGRRRRPQRQLLGLRRRRSWSRPTSPAASRARQLGSIRSRSSAIFSRRSVLALAASRRGATSSRTSGASSSGLNGFVT